jgi:hypothetical protein
VAVDPLVLALVAIGGSVFGIWLGHQFQFRREDRRWRADKKLDAYVSYLTALASYEVFLVRAKSPKVSLESLKAELEKSERDIAGMNVAGSKVELIGTIRAIVATDTVTKLTSSHLKAIREAKPGEKPGFLDIHSEIDEFIAAARIDLGFPKLPEGIRELTK